MNKTLSIKENHLFRALYHRGKSAARKSMVMYVMKRRTQPVNHLGITVSVKLGCAVERNRARRRIRETYRLNETRLKCGFDIVIVARKAAYDAPFEVLEADTDNKALEYFSRLFFKNQAIKGNKAVYGAIFAYYEKNGATDAQKEKLTSIRNSIS